MCAVILHACFCAICILTLQKNKYNSAGAWIVSGGSSRKVSFSSG